MTIRFNAGFGQWRKEESTMENSVKGSIWQARKAPVNSSWFSPERIRISAYVFLDGFLKGCGALFGTAQGPAFGRK